MLVSGIPHGDSKFLIFYEIITSIGLVTLCHKSLYFSHHPG